MSLALLEEYIQSGNSDALTALILTNPGLLQQKTSYQISPLMLSCYFKKPEITAALLKNIEDLSIFEAAAVGKLDVIAHAVYLNPDVVHEFSEDGFSPLG
ncbi:MAG: hypothetical protein WBP45_14140, partial [Daejeonella sp.]